MANKLIWAKDAQSKLKEVPFLFRGMARKYIEKEAVSAGLTEISLQFVDASRAKRNAEKNKK